MNWNHPLFQITMTPALFAGYVLALVFGVATTVAMTWFVIPKVDASRAPQYHGQRYEVISSRECMDTKKYPQYKDEDNANCFGGWPTVHAWDLDRFHDLVDGTDFICVYKDNAMSCFQTGPQTKQGSQ